MSDAPIPDGRQGRENPVTQPRGKLAFVLRWAFSLALIVLALAFIDIPRAASAIASAKPQWLLAGLAVNFLGTIYLPSIITQLAMQVQERRMSLARLVEINLSNRFYILVLPRAAAVAIRWYRYGEGKLTAPSLALMLFERGIQLAALMFLSLLAIFADHDALGAYAAPITLALAGGTALALALLLPFASAGAERLAQRVLAAMSRILPPAIVAKFERLVSAAAVFRSLPSGPALAMMAWSIVATLLFYASAWFAARSIGLEISLLSLVWIRSLVFLMTLIPVTVGGIGVRELGFVGLLGLIGVGSADALAFSAVNFAFQVMIAVGGGFLEGWRVLVKPGAGEKGIEAC